MTVHDWDSFVGALRGIVIEAASKLPASDITAIWESIEGGEPGIAFEDLCTQMQEYEIHVDEETRKVLSEIEAYTGSAPQLWLHLKPELDE